jgi:putative membrane protein
MWEVDPSIAIGLLALAALYAFASFKLGKRPSTRQIVYFASALFVILAALAGPVDYLEDRRFFTAHMFQHILLALFMPPLLLLGLPDWMLRPIATHRRIEPIARLLSNPVIALLVFTAAYALPHAPPIYDLMCRDETVHIATHITFMIGGTIMWWPLMSPLPEFPRLSYPGQIMYLFLLMIPMTAVAAPITLARSVVYSWYLEGPHPFGISPMEDQILGGILMWIGQSFYLICVMTGVFYRWSLQEGSETPAPGARISPAASGTQLRALRPN